MRSVPHSLSEKLARAGRDNGLVGVIARALDVRSGIEEGDDAGALVLMEPEEPEPRSADGTQEKDRRQVLLRDARGEHHAKPYGAKNRCRSEVWLNEHETDDNARIESREDDVPHVSYFDMPPREIFREERYEGELGEVCGLE